MSPEMCRRRLSGLNGPSTAQIVAKHMIERGAGGLSSSQLAENVTGPAQVDYAAAKSGLRGLMFGFATRWPARIPAHGGAGDDPDADDAGLLLQPGRRR